MNLLDKLKRTFRRSSGIPNLMIYITATMLAVFVLDLALPIPISSYLGFSRQLIFQGQIWRLLTFIVIPPSSSILFILLTLYFYYFIGSSLENVWGSFQFTVYYAFGVIGAIIAGLIAGGTTNFYLNLSLFFAFAQLFPNHQVLLFFVIPIKIKYLAYFNWFFFLLSFIQGTMIDRVAILFSLLNFFLFFGGGIMTDIKNRIHAYRRKKKFQQQMKDGQDQWRR